MNDKVLKEQIEIIERATRNAVKSKTSAIRFLSDSGIIALIPAPITPKEKDNGNILD